MYIDRDGQLHSHKIEPEHKVCANNNCICKKCIGCDSECKVCNGTMMTCTAFILRNSKEHDQERKLDAGKLRYDLIPPKAIKALAEVLTYGANKYADNSWQKVKPFEDRYYAALMRHIMAWREGEEIDQESGLSTLSHALCNVMFLLVGGDAD